MRSSFLRIAPAVVASLLLSSVSGAAGDDDGRNRSTHVVVHIPFKLHHVDGEQHDVARFGFASKVGSMSEYVYYVPTDLCQPLTNRTSGHPTQQTGFVPPFFLMVDRGGCNFPTKARFAQQAGASALIVADHKCRCSDADCKSKHTEPCEDSAPPMTDDGSAADISIPSFLLGRVISDDIKTELTADRPVLMQLMWGLKERFADKKTKVRYELWTTAHDPVLDLDTYFDLRTVYMAFRDSAVFSPRFLLVDGGRFNCMGQKESDGPCDHLCTNGGRYCAVHQRELSGRPIVTETLRRLCIWRHYGDEGTDPSSNPSAWWDYVVYFEGNCRDPHVYATSECHEKAYHHAKIDKTIVDQCMNDSGGSEEEGTENSVLEEMLDESGLAGAVTVPAIYVSGRKIEHSMAYSLFDALCTRFWVHFVDDIPDVCFKCGSCPNKIGCLEQGKCVDFNKDQFHHDPSDGEAAGGGSGQKKRKGRGWFIFFFIVFVLAAAAGGYYYYVQYQQNRMGFGNNPFQGYFRLNQDG